MCAAIEMLTAPSYLRRNRPSIHLCPLRLAYRCLHVNLRSGSHVDHGSSGMANRKAARLVAW